MAKKTAKSKGYRKAVQKKPYLSKKDIIILCVLIAVVAVGAILLFTYDDGALKVEKGRIVDPGENWLIVNGNLKGGHRYFKLGEAGDIPGFVRESQPFMADENLIQFNYKPESEDSAVSAITLSASPYDPARLAEGNSKMVASVKDSAVSDVATDRFGDVECTYYTYTHEYYSEAPEAEAAEEAEGEAESTEAQPEETPAEESAEASEDPAPNHFEQALNAYVPTAHDGSIIITISASADSAEAYLTEDQLKDTLAQAIAAVTFEPTK